MTSQHAPLAAAMREAAAWLANLSWCKASAAAATAAVSAVKARVAELMARAAATLARRGR
ncbi:hypothetical protein OG384_04200 [Streptomyces sp. NBC_01324]|uniref:hypothetical protein n=1 Tax=Streptomyces sp. NBC_01324 TaxID=2903826 RepID=UPI002E156C9D|nr:hypothetical protein OG384_04200 [Streptomyces sp. NBC_01324]